jgi:hypothetical protein
MWCRQPFEMSTHPIQGKAGRLNNVILIRNRPCNINMMVVCAGRGPNSDCPNVSWANEINRPPNDPYAGEETVNFWNQASISVGSFPLPRLRIRADMTERQVANVEAKNKALQAIMPRNKGGEAFAETNGDGPDIFRRVDYLAATQESNAQLDHWAKSWDMPPDGNTPDACGHATEIPNMFGLCRLRGSSLPVNVTAHIVKAGYDLSIVPALIDFNEQKDQTREDWWIQIFARGHLHAQIGLRAELLFPAFIEREWLPENDPRRRVELRIVNTSDPDHPNAGFCQHWPIVAEVGGPVVRENAIDEIVFVDPSGRDFDPPNVIDWWGMLGSSTLPVGSNEIALGLDTPDISSNEHICRVALPVAMQTALKLQGWPTAIESNRDDPTQIYEGEMRWRFAT